MWSFVSEVRVGVFAVGFGYVGYFGESFVVFYWVFCCLFIGIEFGELGRFGGGRRMFGVWICVLFIMFFGVGVVRVVF